MQTISINNKDYNIKYTLRSIFIFEEITKKGFEISSTLDQYIFFYSLILANNKDFQMSFDEFIDFLDENPEKIRDFTNFLISEKKINDQFEDPEEKKGDKKGNQ